MDFFGRYQSPFGYENGENGGVDSYGVDHSGFSTQDELQYQTARANREQQLANDLQQQGIVEENYPQYGTNFWGNSDNNYGFGTSNIAQNAQNHPAMNNISANLNNYLIPEETYTNPNWGQQTAAKLDDYMQNYNSYPGVTHTGIAAPFHDMWRNYKTMTDEQNWIGGDNFFHCKANYEAAKRGPWGEIVGKTVSAGREILGQMTGDRLSDLRKDWRANRMGWDGAKRGLSLKEACPTNPKAYVNPDDYGDIF